MPNRPHTAWRGAVEFASFPINVVLYSRVQKQRSQSFRNLAPSGQPVAQQMVDPHDQAVVENSAIRKGVDVGGGRFIVMPPEAIEAVKSGVKTEVAKPRQFVPVDSLAWDLAIDRFAVRPDDKVPGSGQSTGIIWNGLRSTSLACVTQVSLTGGHDGILALYADDQGFWGALLPFEEELYPVPTHQFEVDEKAETLFAQVLEAQHEVEPFDHSAYKSEYRARREAIIDQVVAGKTPVQPDQPASEPIDLIAVLKASVATKTKTPKKTTKKKEASKA